MSKLPPKKFLDISGIKSMEEIKQLPLMVVLQERNRTTIYKVESKDSDSYFMAMGGDPFPFFGSLKHATEKFGKVIPEEDFLNASVFPAQTGVSNSGEYAIYRAKFEKQNKS